MKGLTTGGCVLSQSPMGILSGALSKRCARLTVGNIYYDTLTVKIIQLFTAYKEKLCQNLSRD